MADEGGVVIDIANIVDSNTAVDTAMAMRKADIPVRWMRFIKKHLLGGVFWGVYHAIVARIQESRPRPAVRRPVAFLWGEGNLYDFICVTVLRLGTNV